MPRGFLRIQVLILVLIGILFGLTALAAYSSARTAARDQKRLIDIAQIQTALGVYFTENGYYPGGSGTSEPIGLNSYLEYWPVAPQADGNCTLVQNSYTYFQKAGGDDYNLNFCTSHGTQTLNSKSNK